MKIVGDLHIAEEGEYSHTGKIGDVIYALPAIMEDLRHKRLPTAHLFLYDDYATTEGHMDQDLVANVAPLLLNQAYIAGVSFSPRPVQCHLTGWRSWMGRYDTIVGAHLVTLGHGDADVFSEPWIKVEGRRVKQVIFNLTARWKDHQAFPWEMVAKRFADCSGFVGTQEEHEDFLRLTNTEIPRLRTRNLLDLAQIIAGADLFVGNQSSPFALAAAMRVPRLLDASSAYDNCDWGAPECIAVKKHTVLTMSRVDWIMEHGAHASKH